MRIGYLRVSTEEQRLDRQVDGLLDLCDELHVEKLSAAKTTRPVYDAVVARLRPGDTLVVWDLDRAFRSTVDAIQTAEKLRARDVSFEIVKLPIDPSTLDGKLAYTVMAAFAEYERGLISRRTKEGLAAARQRGKRLGRPPKLNVAQIAAARLRLCGGTTTIAALAAEFGVAPWTLSRSLRKRVQQHEQDEGAARPLR
tara:strand:- start:383 stop:976 length:594 start_codon:yes stop_codon:yes gene_type:complete